MQIWNTTRNSNSTYVVKMLTNIINYYHSTAYSYLTLILDLYSIIDALHFTVKILESLPLSLCYSRYSLFLVLRYSHYLSLFLLYTSTFSRHSYHHINSSRLHYFTHSTHCFLSIFYVLKNYFHFSRLHKWPDTHTLTTSLPSATRAIIHKHHASHL